MTPSRSLLDHFCRTVKNFLMENPRKLTDSFINNFLFMHKSIFSQPTCLFTEKLVGVHCTHGLNRTGKRKRVWKKLVKIKLKINFFPPSRLPKNRIFCLLVHGFVQQCVAIRCNEKLFCRPRPPNRTSQLYKRYYAASFGE